MSEPIVRNEWEAKRDEILRPGEHWLAGFVIGPDIQMPERTTLHMRINKTALEIFEKQGAKARLEFMQKATRLLEELSKIVLA